MKYLKGQPTLTSPLIGQQLVAFLAAALKAAHRISTHMVTSPIVKAALVNICEQKIIKRSAHTTSHQRNATNMNQLFGHAGGIKNKLRFFSGFLFTRSALQFMFLSLCVGSNYSK